MSEANSESSRTPAAPWWATAGGHVLGVATTTAVLTAIPIASYVVLMIVGIVLMGDMGGLLNLILVPLLSLATAVVAEMVFIFPAALLFRTLEGKFVSLTILAPFFVLALCLAVACWATPSTPDPIQMVPPVLFWASWVFYFAGGFTVHWTALHATELSVRVARWLWNAARVLYTKVRGSKPVEVLGSE